jgi:hypothetical protein
LYIRASVRDITGLVRQDVNNGIPLGMFLHETNEILEGSATALANVEDFISMRTVDSANNTIDNVGNVRVIATARSVSKLLNLHTTTHAINKLKGRHIGATAGTVHGEEPQARNVEIVQVVVGVSEKLSGLLSRGVGRNWIVDIFHFRKKGRLGTSIDRTATWPTIPSTA